tara:strand:- start:155 stop:700 length:546 start_codon:yes stop_codon:yes gene_type:complete
VNKPNIDDKSSKYFKYRDFIECSSTYRNTPVNNIPDQSETFLSIKKLSENLLDKIQDKFGKITLTYGFCGNQLQKKIKKGIYPKLDQHSGSELDKNGKLICNRKGFAVDFYIEDECSLKISRWITEYCLFDRIYFYGKKKPIHISLNDAPIQKITLMEFKNIKKVPKNISKVAFLNTEIDF